MGWTRAQSKRKARRVPARATNAALDASRELSRSCLCDRT
jgi:hypothetical protein